MAHPASKDPLQPHILMGEKTKARYAQYEAKKQQLVKNYQSLLKEEKSNEISLKKNTSNLFRTIHKPGRRIDVRAFNQVLSVDPIHRIAEIEGMTSYEEIVSTTLKFGFLPTVVPELKSITIGGALAGVGIESSSFRYGFVHETILEFEVLLGDGRVVTCSPHNENKDLFYAFPNTYGTLGYALKVKVKLIPVKQYVKLTHVHFRSSQEYFDWIKDLCQTQREKPTIDYIDGVVFAEDDLVATIGEFVDDASYLNDYRYLNIYYQSLQSRKQARESSRYNAAAYASIELPPHTLFHEDYLTTENYIWRWDTDWFWCSKHFHMQNFWMRLLLGKWALKSTVYWKIRHLINQYPFIKKTLEHFQGKTETVIQDIEVPIQNANTFLNFFQREIGIKPIWICPIQAYRTDVQFSFYKMDPRTLYINFGFWDVVPLNLQNTKPQGFYNRKIEAKVHALNGNKSLYSNVYYTKEEFWHIYDHALYNELKQQYDPSSKLGELFEKCSKK